MKLKSRNLLALLFLVQILFSHSVLAGAWGVGPFENDDALDFSSQILEYDSFRSIWLAFPSNYKADYYIDAAEGARIVASAALVGAMRSEEYEALPDDLARWAGQGKWGGDVKLAGTAGYWLKGVMDSERSELAQLWQDSAEYDAWKESLARILNQLR